MKGAEEEDKYSEVMEWNHIFFVLIFGMWTFCSDFLMESYDDNIGPETKTEPEPESEFHPPSLWYLNPRRIANMSGITDSRNKKRPIHFVATHGAHRFSVDHIDDTISVWPKASWWLPTPPSFHISQILDLCTLITTYSTYYWLQARLWFRPDQHHDVYSKYVYRYLES